MQPDLEQQGGQPVGRGNERDWRAKRREWREMRRRERYGRRSHSIFWGLAFLLAGFLALGVSQAWISGDSWWEYLLLGIGVILTLDGLLSRQNDAKHAIRIGRFAPGFILILVATLFILGVGQWWPLVLIFAGAGLVLCFFWGVAFKARI